MAHRTHCSGYESKHQGNKHSLETQALEKAMNPWRGEYPAGHSQQGTAGHYGREQQQGIAYQRHHNGSSHAIHIPDNEQTASEYGARCHKQKDHKDQELGRCLFRAMKP